MLEVAAVGGRRDSLSASLPFEMPPTPMSPPKPAPPRPVAFLLSKLLDRVRMGRPPCRADGAGNTLLHLLARGGWGEGVEEYLDWFASDAEERGLEAGMEGSALEDFVFQEVQKTVNSGNGVGATAVHCAVASGCSHTLHMLLEAGEWRED